MTAHYPIHPRWGRRIGQLAVVAGAFALFGGVGVFLLSQFVGDYIAGLRTWGFAQTNGTVQSVSTERANHSVQGTAVYLVKPVYAYTVDGRTYQSDTGAAGGLNSMGRASADQRAAQFAAGAAVTVYYDPRDPATAVLVRGVQQWAYIFAVFTPPFIMIPLMLLASLVLTVTRLLRVPGPGGLRLRSVGPLLAVQLGGFAPRMRWLTNASLTAFVTVIGVAVILTTMAVFGAPRYDWLPPTTGAVQFMAVMVVVAASVRAFYDPRNELVINTEQRWLAIPRDQPTRFAFNDIDSLTRATRPATGLVALFGGDSEQHRSMRGMVALRLKGGDSPVPVAHFDADPGLNEFGEWLAAHVGCRYDVSH